MVIHVANVYHLDEDVICGDALLAGEITQDANVITPWYSLSEFQYSSMNDQKCTPPAWILARSFLIIRTFNHNSDSIDPMLTWFARSSPAVI